MASALICVCANSFVRAAFDVTNVSLSLTSLILAYFSWCYIEKPFRKADFTSQINIFVKALLGLILFSIFGLYGHFNNGYSSLRAYLPFVTNEENVRKVAEERQEEIRAGICHFNGRGKHIKFAEFLENWNCIDSDEGLTPTGIVITGDSHSADKAVSFRLNGFDTYQIGGAGCQLSESYVARDRSYCKLVLQKARDLARDENIQAVFLSSRFTESELSEEYIQSIFNYWNDIDKPIFLWAPMPNFQQQLNGYLRGINSSIRPSNEREEKFYELLKKVNIPQKFS